MRVQTTIRMEHSDHCELHRIAKRDRVPAQRLIEAGIKSVLAANGMPICPAVNGHHRAQPGAYVEQRTKSVMEVRNDQG